VQVGSRLLTDDGGAPCCCSPTPGQDYLLALNCKIRDIYTAPDYVPRPGGALGDGAFEYIFIPMPFRCLYGDTLCDAVYGQVVKYRGVCYVIQTGYQIIPSPCVPGAIVATRTPYGISGGPIVDPLEVFCIPDLCQSAACGINPNPVYCCGYDFVENPCEVFPPANVGGKWRKTFEFRQSGSSFYPDYRALLGPDLPFGQNGEAEIEAEAIDIRWTEYETFRSGEDCGVQCVDGAASIYQKMRRQTAPGVWVEKLRLTVTRGCPGAEVVIVDSDSNPTVTFDLGAGWAPLSECRGPDGAIPIVGPGDCGTGSWDDCAASEFGPGQTDTYQNYINEAVAPRFNFFRSRHQNQFYQSTLNKAYEYNEIDRRSIVTLEGCETPLALSLGISNQGFTAAAVLDSLMEDVL